MSGSYHPVSPAVSEHHDNIGTASSQAGPGSFPLGDVSKVSDFSVPSTQNGQGWEQEEAITTNLLISRFHNENHTNAQRDEHNLRRPDDTLEDLEIHLQSITKSSKVWTKSGIHRHNSAGFYLKDL